ncbi:phage tail protein, partial [Escherichia coli]|nr:phage tail protein [Escherichia coli]EKP7014886.1 phage tail protein [Escherichia coli]
YSEDEADLYFGAGSLAAAMARAAINANSYLQLDVIGIADGGAGKAATGAVKVTGTATSSGTLSVWIAGEQIAINVDVGDEPSKIIPALVTAMTQTPSLLVTGEYKSDTSQLTVTARTKGTWGNDITLSVSTTATGLVVATTPMASGEM